MLPLRFTVSAEFLHKTFGEGDGSATAFGLRFFWDGYRTSKAIAWVIDVGVSKPAWLARFKDQCCGPLPLKEAKAVALAMAKGASGDYRTTRAIDHLNGLAARLLDREAA